MHFNESLRDTRVVCNRSFIDDLSSFLPCAVRYPDDGQVQRCCLSCIYSSDRRTPLSGTCFRWEQDTMCVVYCQNQRVLDKLPIPKPRYLIRNVVKNIALDSDPTFSGGYQESSGPWQATSSDSTDCHRDEPITPR